jgi:hypothetical protein
MNSFFKEFLGNVWVLTKFLGQLSGFLTVFAVCIYGIIKLSIIVNNDYGMLAGMIIMLGSSIALVVIVSSLIFTVLNRE